MFRLNVRLKSMFLSVREGYKVRHGTVPNDGTEKNPLLTNSFFLPTRQWMDQNVPESDGKYIILERFMLHHWIIFCSGATDNLQLTALSHLTDIMNTRPGVEYVFSFKSELWCNILFTMHPYDSDKIS